jgi:hypothetical protein
MAGITGLGTTYNLPNYTGLLYGLTPEDTPFFSAVGGLAGSGQSTSTEFEWQTYDLRAAGQNTQLEGADAPTAAERVRANVSNVCQIQQSQISVSYTKLAAIGAKAGTNNEAMNPVRSELDWQTEQELKAMVRDIEYSFIRGTYQKPSDNTTARKTRGILAAITTNVTAYGTASAADTLTATATTDVIAETATPLADGDQIILRQVTAGAPLATDTVYWVVSKTANNFKVSLTKGGPAVNITADGTAIGYTKLVPLTWEIMNGVMQRAYDNGGLQDAASRVMWVPSHLKMAVSNALLSIGGKYQEMSRNVGGVAMQSFESDFGTIAIRTNRFLPKGTLLMTSLDQCQPVYLEVPGKGHFFAEALAKTGASEKVQLYGEVGLAYGNEAAHAQATFLGQ